MPRSKSSIRNILEPIQRSSPLNLILGNFILLCFCPLLHLCFDGHWQLWFTWIGINCLTIAYPKWRYSVTSPPKYSLLYRGGFCLALPFTLGSLFLVLWTLVYTTSHGGDIGSRKTTYILLNNTQHFWHPSFFNIPRGMVIAE